MKLIAKVYASTVEPEFGFYQEENDPTHFVITYLKTGKVIWDDDADSIDAAIQLAIDDGFEFDLLPSVI
jgi:hypothetical protein